MECIRLCILCPSIPPFTPIHSALRSNSSNTFASLEIAVDPHPHGVVGPRKRGLRRFLLPYPVQRRAALHLVP
jgi:hypothetical protein